MPIRYQHDETVATTPDRAFAALDALPSRAVRGRWPQQGRLWSELE